MNVAALMPVKGFRNAKQRLAPLLGSDAREALAEAMFRDVLRQVRAARGLSATFVVTGNDRVASIASAAGAEGLRERAENGETAAVDFARLEMKNAGCEAALIVPGDIPLVRAVDIEQVLAQVPAGADAPFALLVPSHDRKGTNALLLAPPDIIELRFGYDSFTFHMSQVAARGLPLAPAICCSGGTETARYLGTYATLAASTCDSLRRGKATAVCDRVSASGAEKSPAYFPWV